MRPWARLPRRLGMVRTRSRTLLNVLEVLAAPYSVLARVLPQVAAIAVIIAISALTFMSYQRLDPISAIYAAVGLVTTVGLYTPPIGAMPPAEKVILAVMVGSSVAVYATLISSVISTLTRRSVWVDARARWRARHVKDHVVLLGDLLEVAEELDRFGVEYVMVTKNEALASRLGSRRAIIGDPTSEAELRAAGVEAASSVVVALENDLENLAALIRVRRLNQRARVVVVVHHEDLQDVFKSAGASHIVRMRRYLGRVLAGLALSGNVGGVLLESTEASSRALRQHGYALGFFVVGRGSRCDGAKLGDLPRDVTPVLVERDGRFTPYFSGDFTLRAGDGLVVIGDPGRFASLSDMCRGEGT